MVKVIEWLFSNIFLKFIFQYFHNFLKILFKNFCMKISIYFYIAGLLFRTNNNSHAGNGKKSLVTLILGTILGFFLACLVLSTDKPNWFRTEYTPMHGDPHVGKDLYDAVGPEIDVG